MSLYAGLACIQEMEQTLSHLERGSLVTKFSWKKGVERKTLAIQRDTRQIVWTLPAAATNLILEGHVDWAEIKEVRLGKMSQCFEKWSEEAKEFENAQCFVVFYGSEFNLSGLSIAVASEAECAKWIKGLNYLVKDSKNVSYPLQVQAWLRKEFNALQNQNERMSQKCIKTFLSKINYKVSNIRFRELLNEIGATNKEEISFDEFTFLYQIITTEDNPAEIFDKILLYSCDVRILTVQEVVCFLSSEQNELESDERAVSKFMCDFLNDDVLRHTSEPEFTIPEFLDFLFSRDNEIWNPMKDIVDHDMSKPLSHYWISSSHNTYLTGNQVNSMSSLECYARTLRMGCRCIELDCWDGPDGMPCIFHGHTFTSKIKFMDVIKIIKDNAFVTSEYPVILSIEQCCSLPQQRKMALALQDIFGEMLVVPPVENLTNLPSPDALRFKIILKHKKLPEGQEDNVMPIKNDISNIDIVNSVKNGMMYLEDPDDNEWEPHFFLLTKGKLFYTKDYRPDQEFDMLDDGADNGPFYECVSKEDFNVQWFHGYIEGGAKETEQLIHKYSYLGDGTFLVRESSSIKGNTLSFWYDGQVKHCRIYSIQDRQGTKYFLPGDKFFDNLYDLIAHYQTFPLVTPDFSIVLQKPVPRQNLHEVSKWYHQNTSKSQAEEVLRRAKAEGAFLVRPSENEPNYYTISFRSERKVKHCRIKLEEGIYPLGDNVAFENLVDVIKFYETHPIHDKVKLTCAVSEDMVRNMDTNQAESPSSPFPADATAKFHEDSNESKFPQSMDLNGAAVDIKHNPECPGMEWIIRILTSTSCAAYKCAVESEKLAQEWCSSINQVIEMAHQLENVHREMERTKNIAKEMSNLIIYCRSVNFDMEKAKQGFVFYEMSSFPEYKAEKIICQQERNFFLKYHQVQFSRVYPNGLRLDSSNYNPVNMWNCGSQMVALNFQKGDKPMQLNQAKFRENGRCGYLLKPDFMFKNGFDPCWKNTLGMEPWIISIRIIAARHLYRCRRKIINPFVTVEIIGAPFDSGVKFSTTKIIDNGFNPRWNDKVHVFEVINPHFALLRFLVQGDDVFGESNFIGQATYPVTCLRTGYRSVCLKNVYSECFELAALLIHISLKTNSENEFQVE